MRRLSESVNTPNVKDRARRWSAIRDLNFRLNEWIVRGCDRKEDLVGEAGFKTKGRTDGRVEDEVGVVASRSGVDGM